MGDRVRIPLLLAGALLVGGCTDPSMTTAPEEPVSSESVAQIPHFEGSLPLRLQAGTQVFVDPPCTPEPDRSRICSADGEATYLAYPDAVADSTLVDASMDQTEDRTEWAVTLTFDDPAGPRKIGERATGLAGVLMVVGDDDRVLLVHRPVTVPERSVKAGRITLDATDKASAWDLVESFTTPE